MSHSNPHFCKLSTVTVSSQHNTHYMYGHTQILIFALNCNCHSQHTLIPRTCLYALCKFCSYRETSLIDIFHLTLITIILLMITLIVWCYYSFKYGKSNKFENRYHPCLNHVTRITASTVYSACSAMLRV